MSMADALELVRMVDADDAADRRFDASLHGVNLAGGPSSAADGYVPPPSPLKAARERAASRWRSRSGG